MPLDNTKSGLFSSVEFQSSALPWVTSSVALYDNITSISLPKFTKFVTVSNRATSSFTGSMSFSFENDGINLGKKFILQGGQNITTDVVSDLIYFKSETTAANIEFSILCGLTTVNSTSSLDNSILNFENVSPGSEYVFPLGYTFTRASDQYTVQTSASTLKSGLTGNNKAYIGNRGGLYSKAWSNGLSFEEARSQIVATNPRSVNALTNAGTATQTLSGIAGPDGTGNPYRVQTTSTTFSSYELPVPLFITIASQWTISGNNGTGQTTLSYGSDVATYPTGVYTSDVITSIWKRANIVSSYSSGRHGYVPVDGRNYATRGGLTAGNRDAIVDFMQNEYGTFTTEAISTALATRAAPKLSNNNPNSFIDKTGRCYWTLDWTPSGSPSRYRTPIQISPCFSSSSVGASINPQTGKLSSHINSSQNLCKYSNLFTSWSLIAVSALGGQTDPLGGSTAFKITELDNSNTSHIVRQSGVAASQTVYFSVYAKQVSIRYLAVTTNAAANYAFFDLQTGTVVSSTVSDMVAEIQNVGGGWYRCSGCAKNDSTGAIAIYLTNSPTSFSYTGTGSQYSYIWRAQVTNIPSAFADYVDVPSTTIVDTTWTSTVDTNLYLTAERRAKIHVAMGGLIPSTAAIQFADDQSIINLGSSTTVQGAIIPNSSIDVINVNGNNIPTGLIHSVAINNNYPSWFSGGTTAWVPNALSPYLWLRADLGITLASTGVSQWNDQSGNNNHVSQGTVARQPLYQYTRRNNLPAIWVNEVDNAVSLTKSSFVYASGDFYWYLIWDVKAHERTIVNSVTSRLCVSMGIGASTYSYMSVPTKTDSAFSAECTFAYSGTYDEVNGIVSDDFNLIVFARTGTTHYMWVNGNIGQYTATPDARTGNFHISSPANQAFGGFYECAVINKYLSTSEKASLLSYLNNRYNKSWSNLP